MRRSARSAQFSFLLGILLLCLAGLSAIASAQQQCITPARVEEIKKAFASGQKQAPDPKLKQELIDAARETGEEERRLRYAKEGDKKAAERYEAFLEKKRARVCAILATHGWPTLAAVQTDAAVAFMYLISKALPPAMQLQIYPVVMEADRAREIERNGIFASYVDRLRLFTGSKQLFGTQAYVRNGFLVIAPIEHPDKVDELRKSFQMEPLRAYERRVEIAQQMPLIRLVTDPEESQTTEGPADRASTKNAVAASTDISAADEGEVIRIDTAVVTLDVIVPATVGVNTAEFGRSDFRVFENEKPVEIESFSRTDAPFDIVLLLDLSSSMEKKVGLIRKSTKRFVELKRPGDRVAVVTFSDVQTVVSELEADQAKLQDRIKKIEAGGASYVWDAIVFAQEMLEKRSEPGRRKAIVLMSDGVDNALFFAGNAGSTVSFADLVEQVQRGNTSIFPIFLDTESSAGFGGAKETYASARRTLEYLADQSAGNMYTAKKLDDLEAIYERVLKDVGTVYSFGFSPSDSEVRPGKWRRLRVEVPGHPGLRLKHRLGYFPRPAAPKN